MLLMVLQKKQQFNYKGQMMNKNIVLGFIVGIIIGLLMSFTNAFAHTTTILAPDGSVTVCQVGSNGLIVCV
jgi:hypothetical protein